VLRYAAGSRQICEHNDRVAGPDAPGNMARQALTGVLIDHHHQLDKLPNVEVYRGSPLTAADILEYVSLPKIPSAVWSSGSTFVSMMESPDFGERDDLSAFSLVCHPWIGRILLER
jgi:hypothetical protein